jgi:hypothetical protein
VLGEFADLDPDVVHGPLDLRSPFIKSRCHALQLLHARILRDREIREQAFPLVIALRETNLPLLFGLDKLLLQLLTSLCKTLFPTSLQIIKALGERIKHHLSLGIHGSQAALKAGVMGMRREWIQGREMLPDRDTVDWNYGTLLRFLMEIKQ